MAISNLKSEEIESFPQCARLFASHKMVVENCSEKTVCEYLYDLRTFFRYLLAQKRRIPLDREALSEIDIRDVDIPFLAAVTEDDVYSFLYFVAADRQNGWAARARKLTALKTFYKFLTKTKKYFEQNPTVNIESPKKNASLPKFLSLEESLSLLDAIRSDEQSKTVVRDFCIVTLFLNCGMRVSELVSINLTDIRPGLAALSVIGKGHKERVVYLNDACKSALMDYICERQKQHLEGVSTTALFISGRGDRISVKTVQHIVYKYLERAGLSGRGFSVHKLRHTAATLMYQSGEVDVRVLKDILGHEQLNTTQIYTHVSDKGMETAMGKNPLSRVTLKEDADEE